MTPAGAIGPSVLRREPAEQAAAQAAAQVKA